ncbi:MAG: phosphate acyltransferase PlsX [Nevskiaceae bacterium]|nr:MAG: phosphate acyltransferase PlsX [Nevskiaceae bacterium]TBR73328.1 MAG: phosphate acyltransferase PlsX [Nevskiaceae bacterium]
MQQPVKIAVDAMSGDGGFGVAVDAAIHALERNPGLSVVLVGDAAALQAALASAVSAPAVRSRLAVHPASEVVTMEDAPAQALRHKKDSSMRIAVDLVAEHAADACVSAGNTGALMATAKFVLKMLPGVERPAIVTALPAISGATHVLDLGANAECTAEQLLQFAAMGSALVTALQGIEQPRVALLNIGQEAIKGNAVVKHAAELIQASPLNFVGYVEGDSLFLHPVDVVVCDGFVGNVGLKVGEGVAQLIGTFMREEFMRSWSSRLVGLVARHILHRLAARIDPRVYNGATLIGLRGIVVKSHGSADAVAFGHAIEVAMHEVWQAVPQHIERLVAHSLQAAQPVSAAG